MTFPTSCVGVGENRKGIDYAAKAWTRQQQPGKVRTIRVCSVTALAMFCMLSYAELHGKLVRRLAAASRERIASPDNPSGDR